MITKHDSDTCMLWYSPGMGCVCIQTRWFRDAVTVEEWLEGIYE